MSRFRIERFDSLSTVYSDQLSMFDDTTSKTRRTSSPLMEEPSSTTLVPPPPPTPGPNAGPKTPLHQTNSNSSAYSFTTEPSPASAPQSAPILSEPECELLSQQSFIRASKPGLSRLRSVSFKKPSIAVPKSEGYHNLAYQDDEDDEAAGDNDTFLGSTSSNTTNTFRSSTTYHHPAPDVEHMWTTNESPGDIEPPKPAEEEEAKRVEDEQKEWDRFETLPPPDDDETVDSEWVKISIQWLKIFAYIFTFTVVLVAGVASKSITLLMSSMVAVNHSIAVCNREKSYIYQPKLEHDRVYKVQYAVDSVDRVAWLWCLYFAIIAPYVFAWLRSVRICYFKSANVCSIWTLGTVFLLESLHCIGLSILMFVVLPYIDVTKGAMMMNTACVIPSFLRLFIQDSPNPKEAKTTTTQTKPAIGLASNRIVIWATFTMQLASVACWTWIGFVERDVVRQWYLIPLALILVSFEWWENYLVPRRMHRWLAFLESARKDLEENKCRYFVSCFVMIWKVLLIFGLMILNEYTYNGGKMSGMLFTNFTDGFHSPTVPIERVKPGNDILLDSERSVLYVENTWWPLFFLIIHVVITYVCYAFGKFTCKVIIQEISFAIPVTITVPVTVSFLWAIKNFAIQDKCQLTNHFRQLQYIFWNIGTLNSLGSFKYSAALNDSYGWLNILVSVIWLLCLVSQITNTLHIWKETSERLASTELLFVSPMYNSMMIDQSLAMNRRSIKIVYSGEAEESEPTKEKKELDIESFGPTTRIEELNKEKLLDLNNNNHIGYQNPLYSSFNSSRKKSAQSSDFEEINLDADQHDYEREWAEICASQGIEEDSIDAKPDPKHDDTVRIYACATMWHEDKNEMLQMLKAVMRLDKDQWAQRKAREELSDEESQYYEIEVNIFFDDAFEQGKSDDEDDRVINRFVEQLIDVMNEAANHVLEMNVFIEYPTIVPTPYGGKLIWKLPGGNRLIAHVKDKNLIRHRKRWSQCMYMYYLLGYRLAARQDLTEQRKRKIANNTFVLALDGDINFQPVAVHMVVDLMKKNSKLGAACGRIHPIGGGPIVWYQKFEYAVGHWLQKATEHVFGCVLCSPGCFSLFRARAIMDKSVMHKYTTKPSEALHYVQYDQGEDRWLCTLMLQRGWRIEYCAASDSYTHAPEGFGEFYTQRRRWAPSTMANIMDLLGDYKQTVERNENISLLYIFYQAFLMVGTILSPGTIFLMVVSAMNTALNFDSQTSLLTNVIPILAFTYVCLKFKDNNIKINFAMLLSLMYALLMLAVLVGTGIDMYQQGPLSPNALFFTTMMGSFIVAAIIHPQEFSCVIPLPIYMLLIPSMYMLLTIYSVTNMHIVAWGTREVKSKLSAKELAAQKAEEEARAKEAAAAAAKKSLLSQYVDVSKYGGKNGLFTCMCCSGGQHDDNSGKINEIASNVNDLKVVVNQIQSQGLAGLRRQSFILPNGTIVTETPQDSTVPSTPLDNIANPLESVAEASNEGSTQAEEDQAKEAKQSDIPRWIRNHKRLITFKRKPLHERELHFWRAMIDKYLLPLDEDVKEKKRISAELEELRNKMVFAFGFMNIIFILFVFMLQLHKDVFGIDIPVGIKGYNRTYDEEEGVWHVETLLNTTRMDPIGLFLVVFFGAILFIQIIGMFIHRFGTLAHLIAYTKIELFRKNKDDLTNSEWVKRMVRMTAANKLAVNSNEGEETPPNGSIRGDRRSGFRLDDAFEKQMTKIETDENQLKKMPSLMRKNTVHAMRRRETRRRRQNSFNSLDRSDTMSEAHMSLTSGLSVGGAGNRPQSQIQARPTLETMKSFPATSSAGPANNNTDQHRFSGSINQLRDRTRSLNQSIPMTDQHPTRTSTLHEPSMDTILESSRL